MITNLALGGPLAFNDVAGSLLLEEIHKKSLELTNFGEAYAMQSQNQRSRYHDRGKQIL